MAGLDTTMGGSRVTFPETAWSTVLTDPSASAHRERLNQLCAQYWRPVYRFIRAQWGKSVDDAKDLTQAFFCWVLQEEVIPKYQPREGRFRVFLKSVLKNFLRNDHRNSQRLKRGGDHPIIPIQVEDVEDGGESPEDAFDKQWAQDVLSQSMRTLRKSLIDEGKRKYFEAYEAYDLRGKQDRPTYAQLALSLGLSEDDIDNYLDHVRARLNKLVVLTISESVATRDDLELEVKELFPTEHV